MLLTIGIVFHGEPMPPQVEARAISETRLIWAPYGVDVHASVPGDVSSSSHVRLDVTLVDGQLQHRVTETLGSIPFVDDAPEPLVQMFPNAIAALISTIDVFGKREPQWPNALHNLIVGRVLGRALAHEIGHFLLRTRHHSPHGLMRAFQPVTDLVGADRRRFVLSAEEVMRLERFRRVTPTSERRTN